MKDIRIVFMGTPLFSVPILEALIEQCTVIGAVTQPDKKVGRDQKITFSPVKEVALKHNIPVLQPTNIRQEYQPILDLQPDIIITCAYGQIIPKELLEAPRFKCINVHASLLPKLRGGAPIHRAIIEGYYKTGVTIMFMNEKMDRGDIIRQREIDILDEDNAGTLHNKLSILGRDLLLDTLPDIISGNINPVKQNEREATYAWNLTSDIEVINWDDEKRQVFNRIRGLSPWPGAYSRLSGKIIKIWASRIGTNSYTGKINGEIVALYEDGIGVKVFDGEIIITELQPEGKPRMKAKDYLNGIQDKNSLIGRVFY
ncbi:MAG: methionyl-tRNA formyltransferase [Bacilli bacterium]|jgi:methionyl-tRNA formyltransferase